MKELSIEEKAKRYDEAIEQLRAMMPNWENLSYNGKTFLQDLVHIIPELKESEDERIRKVLLGHFSRYQKEEVFLNNITMGDIVAWLEKQGEQKPNPYSGTSFEYNGHTWGMCARDNGVEILIDGHLDRVFTIDSNAKEMFIKALERVEEQNAKGYKLTDCDKNSWWEDFKAYTSCTIEQKSVIKMKTPEESLGIDSDTYNKIVDECIYGDDKSTWSEEDELQMQGIIDLLPGLTIRHNWLKSLKERYSWKPSDEQMSVLLSEVTAWTKGCPKQIVLESLYNDLLKLKE